MSRVLLHIFCYLIFWSFEVFCRSMSLTYCSMAVVWAPINSPLGIKEPFWHHSCSANCRSCRERALVRAEERLNARKWPWERTGDANEVEEVEDAQHYSNKELYHKFRSVI